jgi:hypothetical protein
LSFSSGFDIRATLSQIFGLLTADNQPHNAAAPISARQQIASASHIVVTFNFRFCGLNGLKSGIAPCPKRAKLGKSRNQELTQPFGPQKD